MYLFIYLYTYLFIYSFIHLFFYLLSYITIYKYGKPYSRNTWETWQSDDPTRCSYSQDSLSVNESVKQ